METNKDLQTAVARFFHGNGGCVEVRILGGEKPLVLHPRSYGELMQAVLRYDGKAGIYFTVNPVGEGMTKAASDNAVKRIRTLLIDVDPVHPAGAMATNGEKASAWELGMRVRHYLEGLGIGHCPVVDSGNGMHIYVWLDTANDAGTARLRRMMLKELAGRFDNNESKIDVTVYNAARVARLPGTLNCKGENKPDRPWRRCAFVDEGQPWSEEVGRANWEKLLQLVGGSQPMAVRPAVAAAPAAVSTREVTRSVAYVQKLLTMGEMPYRQEPYQDGATIFRLERCPWQESHSTESQPYHDAAVIVAATGMIAFHCVHSHCADRQWHDLKEYLMRPIIKPLDFETGNDHFTTLESYYASHRGDLYAGIMPTGYRWLDETIKGFQRGQLTLLAGETGCGKTAFAISLALNLIEQGYRVAYFSNEMTMAQLASRFLLAESKPAERANGPYGYHVPEEYRAPVLGRLGGKLIVHKGSTEGSDILRNICELGGVDVVFVDNLMSTGLNEESLWTSQKQFVLRLTTLAKNLDANVVLLAHTRKTDHLARLGDVYGASAISNLADTCLMLHRGDSPGQNDFSRKMVEQFRGINNLPLPLTYDSYVEVLKNRDFGVKKWIGLKFDAERNRMVDDVQ